MKGNRNIPANAVPVSEVRGLIDHAAELNGDPEVLNRMWELLNGATHVSPDAAELIAKTINNSLEEKDALPPNYENPPQSTESDR